MSDKTTAVTAWEALFRAQVSVMRYLNAEFPSGELSLNEYDVLFNLSRQPGQQLRMKDLNRHLLLTQPSVSRLVDRLTARGLLAKTHDQDDARGVNVALTPAGFDLFRRVARSHIESIAERVGGSLSVTELETLTELCDRLRLSAG
ncbi:MarR family winged helix-turn-helix transcriptional regulator [Glaciihabitans sp. INWT7]|uniref:MarR family winged helix-turn-helix transcriptional regulator n=1 Tax=Glaciihabitans sp. INWT7 TaxID=2596912 RepID=UPI00351C09BF